MADEKSISSLADAFREQRYLTYAEEELSPARDNFGRWFGTPYGYMADPDEGLPDELFGRMGSVASSASKRDERKGAEEKKEPEEPHWVVTEIEDNPANRPTYESVETAEQNMQKDLEDIFASEGIHAEVTSGLRKPGEAGKIGDASWHTKKNGACDVRPKPGYTFEDIRREMSGSKRFTDYIAKYNYGVIDETVHETKRKTGATGDHWHIGKDSKADRNFFATERRGGRLERGLDYMRILREYGQ